MAFVTFNIKEKTYRVPKRLNEIDDYVAYLNAQGNRENINVEYTDIEAIQLQLNLFEKELNDLKQD